MEFLQEFSKAIDLEKTRITTFPEIILLCGGKYSIDPKEKAISLRNYIFNHIKNMDKTFFNTFCYVPEEIDDFTGIYKDLVTFERDFASLVSLIIVLVESPGSIAELGVFSQVEAIAKKMIVIIDSNKRNKKSFITRGPINYLNNNYGKDSVLSYNIFEERKGKEVIFSEQINDIVSDIKTSFEVKKNKDVVFKKDDVGHQLLLLYELISFFGALKRKELEQSFNEFNIEIENYKIKRFLFLLEEIKLIKSFPYGHENYYLPEKNGAFLKLYFSKDFKDKYGYPDKARFILEQSEKYQKEDSRRFSVIKTNMVNIEKGEQV